MYNGEEGKELGLVDGVGSMVEILQEKYPGSRIEVEKKPGPMRKLLSSF